MVRIVSTASFSGSQGKSMPLFNGSLYHEISGIALGLDRLTPSVEVLAKLQEARRERQRLSKQRYRDKLKAKGLVPGKKGSPPNKYLNGTNKLVPGAKSGGNKHYQKGVKRGETTTT